MRNSMKLAAAGLTAAIGLVTTTAYADAATTVKIGGAVHHVKIWIEGWAGFSDSCPSPRGAMRLICVTQ
jgi:hypothetical protein